MSGTNEYGANSSCFITRPASTVSRRLRVSFGRNSRKFRTQPPRRVVGRVAGSVRQRLQRLTQTAFLGEGRRLAITEPPRASARRHPLPPLLFSLARHPNPVSAFFVVCWAAAGWGRELPRRRWLLAACRAARSSCAGMRRRWRKALRRAPRAPSLAAKRPRAQDCELFAGPASGQ